MLGYGIDHRDALLRERLADARADRELRSERMAARLAELGLEVDERPLAARRAAGKPIGRPHLAAAVLAHPANDGAPGRGGPRRSLLVHRRLPDSRRAGLCRADEADDRRGHRLDPRGGRSGRLGPPVLGHQGRADGPGRDRPLPEAGLDGVECFYVTHDAHQTQLLADRCAELGLISTASSDYHGPGHRMFARFLAYGLYEREPRLDGLLAAG